MTDHPPQPDCFLFGRVAQIRALRYADLSELAAWPPHTDPLLRAYNLHLSTPADWRHWLKERQKDRWPYAIRNRDGLLVGHLSLRQMDPPRSSRLGVVLGAPHIGRGYGTDAMRIFLDYYFGELGFGMMRLDVSGANIRARLLYRRLGFNELGSFWQPALDAEDWGSVKDEERLQHFRQGQVRMYEMSLRAPVWRRVRSALA